MRREGIGFLEEDSREIRRDVAFPDGIVPGRFDGGGFPVGAPVVADMDDVDVAPFGDRDQEGSKLFVLTFEDPAQLQPEVWPEDWHYVGIKTGGELGRHGAEYRSVPGGGG